MEFLFDKDAYRKYLVVQYLYDNREKKVLKKELGNHIFGCSKTIMTTIQLIKEPPIGDRESARFEIKVDYKWVRGTFDRKFNIDKLKEFYLKESIAVKIILQLFEKNELILSNFSDENYYTQTIVKNKMKELNQKLKEHNIQLEVGNVIRFNGSEENIQFFYVQFFRYVSKQNWKFLKNESNEIMNTLLSVEYLGEKIISPVQQNLLWDLNYLIRVMEKRNEFLSNQNNSLYSSIKNEELVKKFDYINRVQHFKIDQNRRFWLLYVILSNINLSAKKGLYKDYERATSTINETIIIKFQILFVKLKLKCKEDEYAVVRENVLKGKLLQLLVNDCYHFQLHLNYKIDKSSEIRMSSYALLASHFLEIYENSIFMSLLNKSYFSFLILNHLAIPESSKYSILVDTSYGSEWDELLLNQVLTVDLGKYFKGMNDGEELPDLIVTDNSNYSLNESDIFFLRQQTDDNLVQQLADFLYLFLVKKKITKKDN